MELHPPLYWIIDGLDEAQSPHHLLSVLADIGASKLPVRVIVACRSSPSLTSAFERLSPKVNTTTFSIDHDLTDIGIYVREELGYNNWGDEITETVTTRILAQSKNNFLWVHLVLEELRDCNTQEDINERLAELPPGMDQLYQRMGQTIANIRRPSDMNLAHRLLQWAVYAQRPVSAAELVDILEPEFGRLLDISLTASRLCGHFIAIEGGDARFGLIHQTAREYLTSTPILPLSLKADASHATLFKHSLSPCMDENIRTKLQQPSSHFFEYCVTSWPHHLRVCEMYEGGEEQLDILASFFTQKSVFAWIYALASLSQLKILITASRVLASFIRSKREADTATDRANHRCNDLEYLEGWSRDFLKILGKFGSSLSQRPELIYTGVTPFCPTNSSIHKLFGKQSSNSLVVKGLTEEWDDCLTRLSIGGWSMATLLSCSPRYLAAGNTSGLAIIWDAATFRQVSVIEHGDTVELFCFSAKGDRFATYGFRSTKIWDPETGQVLQEIPNSTEIQASCMQFTENDDALIMVSYRHCVIRASLSGEQPLAWHVVGGGLMISNDPLEGAYRNDPDMMALSPDGSKVAIAYRRYPASIWSAQPTRLLKTIARPQRPGQTSQPVQFVKHMSWHPEGEEVMGLFQDGCTFKMNLVDGSYEEQPATPGQVASQIICSPDGLVYVICGVGGTINLFDYKSSTLIYQLNSEGMVHAFCFSYDGRRFCDIRSRHCTVWEPNALMRLASADDDPEDSQAPDDSIKQSQVASETFIEKTASIALMSPMPKGPVLCFGDEDGNIELLDYDKSERVQVGRTATGMSVRHLVWSDDCKRCCYAELRGRLSLIQVEQSNAGWKTQRIEKFKAQKSNPRVSQLAFLPGGKSILVASASSAEIWSLEPNKLEAELKFEPTQKPRKWIVHPRSKDHLLSVTSDSVYLHENKSLLETDSWRWEISATGQDDVPSSPLTPVPDTKAVEEVNDVYPTFNQSYILVKMSAKSGSRYRKNRLIIFDASSTTAESKTTGATLSQVHIPREISDMVEVCLNVLPSGDLIFIDASFWVCSWKLKSERGGGVESVERHFFIPRDWLPVKSQGMLHLLSSGAIICPRNGAVSVIDGSIG